MLSLAPSGPAALLPHGGKKAALRGASDRAPYAFGVSEPMPVGVLMVVHVPFLTIFQASPW